MTEFFVPTAETPEKAERLWIATKKFAEDTLGWEVTDRRIFRLSGIHDGEAVDLEVGKTEPYERETVLLILESNTYLVCTANRGVLAGQPILVGHDEVVAAEDFDSARSDQRAATS